MARGFLCDGPCQRFWPGNNLGAEVRFMCLVDESGSRLPDIDAHVCPDCVVELLAVYGPAAAAARALQIDVDDDFKPEGEQ